MTLSKRLLIIGGGLILLSGVIEVFVPMVGYVLVNTAVASGQDLLVAMNVVLALVAEVVPALGASVFGAGLVIPYLERRGSTSPYNLGTGAVPSSTEPADGRRHRTHRPKPDARPGTRDPDDRRDSAR